MYTRRRFLLASIALAFVLPRVLYSKSASQKTNITKSQLKVLSRLARCIAEVETGNNDDLMGKVGERSKYQISESVWRQHYGNRAFIECYGINADECAIKHLTWLSQNKLPSPAIFWLAYAWNAGLTRANEPEVSFSAYPFAKCVENLYNDRNFK